MSPLPPDPRAEFAFINWLQSRKRTRAGVRLGIGDDCAVLPASSAEQVVCVDVLMEGVHFTPETPAWLIGRKALAVNLSDIAAMAARPVAAFVGLVLPRTWDWARLEDLFQGLASLADDWNVTIAGGDTNSWDGPLVISVTVTGTVGPRGAVTRSGAQAGDWIFVTGALGGSLASGRHLRFHPRIDEATILSDSASLHSMLDVSDGVAGDLFHILRASGVGARLEARAIPIHDDVDRKLPFDERLHHALSDGEDFELLFTISPEDGQRLIESPPFGTPLTKIGEITAEMRAGIVEHGSERELHPTGWGHSLGFGFGESING